MDDKEIIEWAKEHYPQYLENYELIKSLYKRQVLNTSVYADQRKFPYRTLKNIKEGERAITKAIIVEIRKSGIKNKKWFSVILGDNSGMIPAIIFMEPEDKDIEEGHEYLMTVTNRTERGYVSNIEREVNKDESIAIDSVYEYVYDLNNGRVGKERLMTFLSKRGMSYDEMMKIFNFKDEGDVISAW